LNRLTTGLLLARRRAADEPALAAHLLTRLVLAELGEPLSQGENEALLEQAGRGLG
jgi:hypothetical protein